MLERIKVKDLLHEASEEKLFEDKRRQQKGLLESAQSNVEEVVFKKKLNNKDKSQDEGIDFIIAYTVEAQFMNFICS